MYSIKKIALAVSAGALFSATAIAQDVVDPAADGWVGTVGAGLVMTGGNTETETGNALFDVTRSIGAWTHNFTTSALWSSDSVRTTAEKYFLSLQSNRALSDRSYLFGYASYDDDRFSGFDYQATAALGYGYKVIATDAMNLNLEVGPGYRISRAFDFQNPVTMMPEIDEASGLQRKFGVLPKNNEMVGRFAETFDWQFSDNAKLIQELNIEAGSDNTVTRFIVAVETNVIGAIALRVSYGLKNNSDVAPGTEKTDTETGISLAYSF
ncbi:MAG: YdiY family protein [Pseudomonadales bacterium]